MTGQTDQSKERMFSIEEAILGLKRPLKIYSVVVVGINILILTMGLWINFKDKKPVEYSSMEACYFGMKQVIANNPQENLVNEKLVKVLSEKEFQVDRIHLVKQTSGFNCDVFTKDSKGVKRYQVALEKNSKFDHMYRLLDIREVKVDSRYQL